MVGAGLGGRAGDEEMTPNRCVPVKSISGLLPSWRPGYMYQIDAPWNLSVSLTLCPNELETLAALSAMNSSGIPKERLNLSSPGNALSKSPGQSLCGDKAKMSRQLCRLLF